ncbi:MAG TPA: hypothetical protein VFV34_04165 [Blastocatellia bacterium]|nr:hypothetical protein [Blastocatellia bacterium]
MKLGVTADIEALPPYVNRIENATINHGEELDGFNIWPATQPRLTLEQAERLTMSLRIRRSNGLAGTMPIQEGSVEGVDFKLRQQGAEYWLDLTISAGPEPGPRTAPINLKVTDGLVPQLGLSVRMKVLPRGLVVTPATLELGEISLAESSGLVGRIGIRRTVGSLQIKSISSTLSFLKLEMQTVVAGSNYLIRVTIAPGTNLSPGPQNGTIAIETDDRSSPHIDVPVRITFLK